MFTVILTTLALIGPVDPSSRAEVRGFYNAVYQASEEVPMETTADVGMCVAGTNSSAFQNAVLNRINWFRAMAGVPSNVTFDETYSQHCQLAALMMSAQGAVNHDPPSTWACWSGAGSNAAHNANLIIDTTGPDAITSYMDDFGTPNRAVGHRRFLLYPQTQRMGTGDVPGQATRPPANATWIIDENYSAPRPPTRQPQVAWPPAGFVPYPVVFRRWSFSYPGASFAPTTISMSSNGVPISVAKESVINGVGENTLVWAPAGLNPNTPGYRWPRPSADTTYTVSLTNVFIRGNFSNFNYTVTIFDPDVASAEATTTLSGPLNPMLGAENRYAVQPVSHATRYEWRATKKVPWTLQDDAEQGSTNFVVSTSPGYSVILAGAGVGASRAFHLAHPQPVSRQSLRLKTLLTPAANGMLRFKSRLGFSGDGQRARVQASTDAGTSWVDLYVQPGSGGAGETGFNDREIALGSFVGHAVQLRFTYDFMFGGFFSLTDADAGWLIDDILLSDCWALLEPIGGSVVGGSFVFQPNDLATYWLDARGLMFDQFGLAYGPGLTIQPVSPPLLLSTTHTGGQLRIEFSPGGAAASEIQLQRTTTVRGPWTLDAQAILGTNQQSARPQFSTPVPQNETVYFRLVAP